jgi:O-antigen/teichoic acid export membrane protein
MLLAGCALRTVQATDTTTEFAVADYLGLRIVSLLAALLVVATIALVLDFSPLLRAVIVAVGVAKAIESLSDLLHGALQQREQMDWIGTSLVLRGVLCCVSVVGAVAVVREGLPEAVSLAAAIAIATGSLVVLLCYDVRVASHGALTTLRPRFQSTSLFTLAWLTLPLGFTVLLSSLTVNIPRYLLEQYRSEAELGVFAALAYLTLLGNLVATALANAALPRLSKCWAAAEFSSFRSLLAKLLAIGALLGGIGIVVAQFAGYQALSLAYGAEYASHNQVFVVLTIAMALGFLVCFLDHALYAARRFRVQVPLNLASLALMSVASVAWIPAYGMIGAAWATCATMVFQLTVRCVIVGQLVWGRATPASLERQGS